jgi:hypothetical protein
MARRFLRSTDPRRTINVSRDGPVNTRFLLALACGLLSAAPVAQRGQATSKTFHAAQAGEAVATIRAGCARCSWGESGREAAALRIAVDGRYSQHLLLVRGEAAADYPVTLGALSAGAHTIEITRDSTLSASGAGAATVASVDVAVLDRKGDDLVAQSMAPVLHARANTVGRFTDLPILMWYEIVPTPRGRQFRYSVIFTNEDGGTATDRLMATWGRTTDIEFVYGVELDATGAVVSEQFQGPGHEVPAFTGRHEARHPLLWVSTDNNMVSESGSTSIRYAPAPERVDMRDVSREVVMDRHAWSYVAAAQEMRREGKIVDDAAAGSGKIPDPRRFVFVEACTDLENAAVAFSVRATSNGTPQWFDSDRGLRDFRIVRSGCFRGGVPLPAGAGGPDAVRFRAVSRAPARDGEQMSPGRVRLTRVNQVFTIGDDYLPRPSTYSWRGSLVLPLDGDWVRPE